MYLKKKLVQIKTALDSSFFALGPHLTNVAEREGRGGGGNRPRNFQDG
jgi:hypothetical protein